MVNDDKKGRILVAYDKDEFADFEFWWDQQPIRMKSQNLLMLWRRGLLTTEMVDEMKDDFKYTINEQIIAPLKSLMNGTVTMVKQPQIVDEDDGEEKMWQENDEKIRAQGVLSNGDIVVKGLPDYRAELHENPQFLEIRERIETSKH